MTKHERNIRENSGHLEKRCHMFVWLYTCMLHIQHMPMRGSPTWGKTSTGPNVYRSTALKGWAPHLVWISISHARVVCVEGGGYVPSFIDEFAECRAPACATERSGTVPERGGWWRGGRCWSAGAGWCMAWCVWFVGGSRAVVSAVGPASCVSARGCVCVRTRKSAVEGDALAHLGR